jgi:hypothetical protein
MCHSNLLLRLIEKGYQELVSLEDINTAIENAGKLEI